MQSRGNKRKQLDQYGGSENEPPEKKQPTRTSVKMPGKNGSKALSKKKPHSWTREADQFLQSLTSVCTNDDTIRTFLSDIYMKQLKLVYYEYTPAWAAI